MYIHFYRKNMQNLQMAVLQDAEVCNKYTTMQNFDVTFTIQAASLASCLSLSTLNPQFYTT